MGAGVADVLGEGGAYRDPVWRIRVELTDLEQALLRCWPVRRLAFIAHAGASAISTTQTYTRIEHSLGVLALVADVSPEDHLARAAALLHDVGHLPLSHTAEGVAGLEHHALGAARIRELDAVLARHGLDADEVIDVVSGRRPSALSGVPGVLKLDHLDSWMRSARVHGRTREPPPQTLARLRVVAGCVSTDPATAGYLVELMVGEAHLHTSAVNVVPTAVVRHLAGILLDAAPAARVAELAAMTDEEFWVLLMTDRSTADAARALRADPTAWHLRDPADVTGGPGGIRFTLRRLYLDLPLVDGTPMPTDHPALTALAALPTVPWHCTVVPPTTLTWT